MMGRLVDNLSYANVMATFALFASLGGISYAAATLPVNSVGARQLRAGAVGVSALKFPLGTVGIANNKSVQLGRGGCNGGREIVGDVAPDCTPPPHGVSMPGDEIHLHFQRPGSLLASGVVGLKYEGAPQTDASVTLELNVNHRRSTVSEVALSGGQVVQVPIQTLATISAGGMSSAGIGVQVEYHSPGAGDVVVSNASLIAGAFPRGAKR